MEKPSFQTAKCCQAYLERIAQSVESGALTPNQGKALTAVVQTVLSIQDLILAEPVISRARRGSPWQASGSSVELSWG